jgi:acyl-CoA synthetase (AMP-forming)/AMP-acid ligase II
MLATEIRIVGPDGAPLPNGTVGEIAVRGPQLMRGYWNLADATAECLRDGWMHTGDAGVLDDEGFLYVQDRTKDMIVSGGENVYPREVEDVLYKHPAVADAAVIGVPDPKWGEAVKAVVVVKAGQTARRRRADRALPRPARRLQATALGRLRRRAAAQSERQGAEARAAREVLDRPLRRPGELKPLGASDWR